MDASTQHAAQAPADARDAAALMRACSAERRNVLPAGARTHLHDRSGRAHQWRNEGEPLVLSTTAMTAIEEYAPEDLTITAAAGATMADVQRIVAANGQWIATDDAAPGVTIGAWAATAAAGPLSLAYGSARDQVLGLQLVAGDGRVLELGGKVVKNVAGYDLVRPVVGSFGCLGLITRVSIRLRPLPAHDVTLVWCLSPEAALRSPAVIRVIARAWPVAACRVVDAKSASDMGLRDAPTILVRVHGNAPDLAEARRRLAGIVSSSCWSVDAQPGEANSSIWSILSSNKMSDHVLAAHDNGARATLAGLEAGVQRAFDPAGILPLPASLR